MDDAMANNNKLRDGTSLGLARTRAQTHTTTHTYMIHHTTHTPGGVDAVYPAGTSLVFV